MRAHSHAIFGFAGAIALNTVVPYLPTRPDLLAGALAAIVLGGLVPDIDANESRIRQITHTNRRSGCLGLLVSWLMPAHRGLTHEPMVVLLLAALALWLRHLLLWAFALGYAFHLLSDALTRFGIPLLGRWRLHLLPKPFRIKTGSWAEHLISVILGMWLWFYGLHTVAIDWSPLITVWSGIRRFIHT
ncbi:MAG: metal-dependent hydrolase [Candidatus Tectomicrobia bacterium]|uniref:Metal-dependent hydrolase n=1 Tax=Tectimicrobiota bacterium TaxID=2528274 RepID=A0A932CQL3_UNCTE|nr:metal-dependent hydrolase [Candidatus Tectomicrobia bacterium]